jgi:N utilization substance protein A
MTEEQESKRRTEEFVTGTELFMEALQVEEVIAQLLSAEGFGTVEHVASCDPGSLRTIEGFDEALIEELKNRAIQYVEGKNEEIIEKLEQLGVEQELIDALELQPEYILKLAEYGVKTIEDLGETTYQEFRSIVPESSMSREDLEALISFAKKESNQE